jgi:hypothetical protein
MGGILGVIGILGIFKGNTNAAYGIGSLMILLNFGYNISVGPLCEYTVTKSFAMIGSNEGAQLIIQATLSLLSCQVPEYDLRPLSLPESSIFSAVSSATSSHLECFQHKHGTGARYAVGSG